MGILCACSPDGTSISSICCYLFHSFFLLLFSEMLPFCGAPILEVSSVNLSTTVHGRGVNLVYFAL
ncbi:hypothetical protein GLYMA_16G036151v4 [Glycine max]|nr:hypothetical protein GLYMA_16G036151v4 [Glycine max]KAH1149814.1 hypothetical protein GYH30_044040 [Glycine max]